MNALFLIPKVRNKVIGLVGHRLGVSGSADSLTYTPWNGVRIGGFRVGDGTAIAVESISCDVAETALFEKEIALRDIRAAHGKFTFLYRPQAAERVVTLGTPSPGVVAPPVPAISPDQPVRAAPAPPPVVRPGWKTTLGSVRIEDLALVVRATVEGEDLFRASGITIVSETERGSTGTFATGRITAAGHTLTDSISGEVARSGGDVFTVSSLEGTVLNGSLSGAVQIAPRKPGVPFGALIKIGGLTHPEIDGVGEVLARVQGGALSPASWSGQVSLDTPEGVAATAFPDQRFVQAQLHAVLGGGVLRIADARAIGEETSFRASGWVTLSGDLGIHLRPYVLADSIAVAQQLAASVLGVENLPFQALPPSPLAFTDLVIRGSVAEPQLLYSANAPPVLLKSIISEVYRSRVQDTGSP